MRLSTSLGCNRILVVAMNFPIRKQNRRATTFTGEQGPTGT
jgi:hypothetical protein